MCSHIGGFLAGLLAGMVFVPDVTLGLDRIWLVRVVGGFCLSVVIALEFLFFFTLANSSAWCSFCSLVDCVPIMSEWCSLDRI